jgi:hypothetical protein
MRENVDMSNFHTNTKSIIPGFAILVLSLYSKDQFGINVCHIYFYLFRQPVAPNMLTESLCFLFVFGRSPFGIWRKLHAISTMFSMVFFSFSRQIQG